MVLVCSVVLEVVIVVFFMLVLVLALVLVSCWVLVFGVVSVLVLCWSWSWCVGVGVGVRVGCWCGCGCCYWHAGSRMHNCSIYRGGIIEPFVFLLGAFWLGLWCFFCWSALRFPSCTYEGCEESATPMQCCCNPYIEYG